jgi:hypothetical protein
MVLNFMVHLLVLWTRECAAGLLLKKESRRKADRLSLRSRESNPDPAKAEPQLMGIAFQCFGWSEEILSSLPRTSWMLGLFV